jgi:hypothetical protein
MTAYDLSSAGGTAQTGLFDTFGRRRRLEVALDALAERFGGGAVQRGDDVATPRGVALTPNLDFLDEAIEDGDGLPD